MSPLARREYVRHMQGRYKAVGRRSEKNRLLTEVSENLGCWRKHAIRLMNGKIVNLDKPWRRREKTYPERLVGVLEGVWEAAQKPWSVRLKAMLPLWIVWIRQEWALSREEERQLLAMSAATRFTGLNHVLWQAPKHLAMPLAGEIMKEGVSSSWNGQHPLMCDPTIVHLESGFSSAAIDSQSASCSSRQIVRSLLKSSFFSASFGLCATGHLLILGAGQTIFTPLARPLRLRLGPERFDESLILDDLRATMRETVKHGCTVEIAMKDVHTLHGESDRLTRWVNLARQAAREFYPAS